MNTIKLDALTGSHPLGALASFGLLRVLAQSGVVARLWFEEVDDWVARVDSPFTSPDELIKSLTEWIQNPREELLAWTGDDDVRVPESMYREVVGAQLRALDEKRARVAAKASSDKGANGHDLNADLEHLAFLSALAAEGARDKSKGLIKPTAFYMASGQQSFCATLRELLAHVRGTADASFREALFGPWAYSTPIWGAGWDPGTERMHALRHKAPTKEKTSSVGGAVYLGFEALALFPSFSVRGRDQTVGFTTPRAERYKRWRWPVPSIPVGVDTLAILLASPEVVRRDGKELDHVPLRPGIGAVYEATRHEFGQGYGVFRPARRVG